ncbi:hypothetical protein CHA01nite_18350 [Chryseobacterium hagamense]|uniref:Uncharacterized protein n=1 Tax=Chryseobacterium hagamense TaxID=395935 RepID=A0A511YLK9_9FLAO|nr:hypothetical protein CHA01nite_18350 [Chryseobacterium hagamense]
MQFFPGILLRNFIVDKHFEDFMKSFRFEPHLSIQDQAAFVGFTDFKVAYKGGRND